MAFFHISENLSLIKGSLSRGTILQGTNFKNLRRVIESTSSYHGLYTPNRAKMGQLLDWVKYNLNNQEIDQLCYKINCQKDIFHRFNVFGERNSQILLSKDSNFSYCDPFTVEPKVYSGHLILHPSEGLENNDFLKCYEFPKESVMTEIFEIGMLRIRVDEERGKVIFKVKGKVWNSKEREMNILPGKAGMFRKMFSLISTKDLALVDCESRVFGRVWHSMDIESMVTKLNNGYCIYYQENPEKVMIAGDYLKHLKMWCV